MLSRNIKKELVNFIKSGNSLNTLKNELIYSIIDSFKNNDYKDIKELSNMLSFINDHKYNQELHNDIYNIKVDIDYLKNILYDKSNIINNDTFEVIKKLFMNSFIIYEKNYEIEDELLKKDIDRFTKVIDPFFTELFKQYKKLGNIISLYENRFDSESYLKINNILNDFYNYYSCNDESDEKVIKYKRKHLDKYLKIVIDSFNNIENMIDNDTNGVLISIFGSNLFNKILDSNIKDYKLISYIIDNISIPNIIIDTSDLDKDVKKRILKLIDDNIYDENIGSEILYNIFEHWYSIDDKYIDYMINNNIDNLSSLIIFLKRDNNKYNKYIKTNSNIPFNSLKNIKDGYKNKKVISSYNKFTKWYKNIYEPVLYKMVGDKEVFEFLKNIKKNNWNDKTKCQIHFTPLLIQMTNIDNIKSFIKKDIDNDSIEIGDL